MCVVKPYADEISRTAVERVRLVTMRLGADFCFGIDQGIVVDNCRSRAGHFPSTWTRHIAADIRLGRQIFTG